MVYHRRRDDLEKFKKWAETINFASATLYHWCIGLKRYTLTTRSRPTGAFDLNECNEKLAGADFRRAT